VEQGARGTAGIARSQNAVYVLPHDWKAGEEGYTEEEWKMVKETRKIMGDESILVSTLRQGPYPGPPGTTFSTTHYTAIIRIGDAAIVLTVYGWETASPKREDVDRFVQAAVARATTEKSA